MVLNAVVSEVRWVILVLNMVCVLMRMIMVMPMSMIIPMPVLMILLILLFWRQKSLIRTILVMEQNLFLNLNFPLKRVFLQNMMIVSLVKYLIKDFQNIRGCQLLQVLVRHTQRLSLLRKHLSPC